MKLDKNILIGKYLSGNISDEEQNQLNTWLEEHPAHRRELEETKKLWSVSANLKIEKKYDAEQAWEEFSGLVQSQPKIRKLYLSPLRIAAGLALIVSTVLVVRFILSEQESDTDTIFVHEQVQLLKLEPSVVIETPDTFSISTPGTRPVKVKRRRQLAMTSVSTGDSAVIYQLPDGSKVYLNKNSSLAYSNNGRTVELNGEAFFEVKQDTLPFYITCKSTITRAAGTSVNIKGYKQDEQVEVMVLVGQVEVTDARLDINKMVLSAGDFASCSANKDRSFVKSKIGKKEKWWRKGGLKNRIKKFFKKLSGKKE